MSVLVAAAHRMTTPAYAAPRQVRLSGAVGVFGFLQMAGIYKRGGRTRCRVRLVDAEGVRILDCPAELVGLEAGEQRKDAPTVTIEVEAVLQVCPPVATAESKVEELLQVVERERVVG